MKRAFLLLLFLAAFPLKAQAQGFLYQAGPFSSDGYLYMCPVPSGGTPCASPVSIFSDKALTQSLPDPIHVALGSPISFWVAAGQYTVQFPATGFQVVISLGGGGGTTAFSTLTPATNSNAGTFAFSGNTLSLASASVLLPTASSCSASGTNNIAVDGTNNNSVFWNGLSCEISLGVPSGAANPGDVVGFSVSSGSVTAQDLGAPNGSCGVSCVFMQSVSGIPNTSGDYLGVDATGKWNELTPGFVIQTVASPLTMTSAQRGHFLYMTGSGAQTASIPGPSQTGFGLSYYNQLWASGAGAITATPANGAVVTGGCNNVSAAASAVIDAGAYVQVVSDNTNYFMPCAISPYSTDTFTNKTFDTAGTGNVFKASGNTITGAQGNGAKLQLSTGTTTLNDCVKFDTNGNTVDAGAACGGAPSWSSLTNPSANLALSTMGTNTTTFDYATALASAFNFLNNTAAISGTNQSGPQVCLGGTYWTGTVSANDSYCLADVVSAGTNPTTTLTATHAGSTGTNQFSAGGWLFGSGGGITPPGGVSISFAPSGAAQSLTLRGAFISAGNSGLFLAQGGNNSGTGTAGNMQVFAGGNSSTGPNGALQIGGEYVKGTTVTVNNLETISADSTIADAAASPVSVAGTAFGTVTANPIQVLYTGEALINSSAAAAVNQTVCAGTTASQVTPSSQYSCPAGPAIGIVKSIANNGASSTLPLVDLNAKIGGPLTAFVTSNYTNATTGFTNVTGLSFPVAASTSYKIRCDLDYQTSATTADIKIQWTGPASPTNVTYDMISQITGSTLSSAVATAFSTSLSGSGTPSTATNLPLSLTMTLINGTTAGTVQLQAAATGTGTVTIIPGACSLQ